MVIFLLIFLFSSAAAMDNAVQISQIPLKQVSALKQLAFCKVVQTMQSDEDYCKKVVAEGLFGDLSIILNELSKKQKIEDPFIFGEKTNLVGCLLASSDHALFLIHRDKYYIKNLKNNQEYVLSGEYAGRGIFLLPDLCIRSWYENDAGLTVFNFQSDKHSFREMNIGFGDDICVLDHNLIGCSDDYKRFSIFRVTESQELQQIKSWGFSESRTRVQKLKTNLVAMVSHLPNILHIFDYSEGRDVNSVKLTLKYSVEIVSNNDNYIAAYGNYGLNIIIFDITNPQIIQQYREFLHSDMVKSACFDKTRQHLISGTEDSKVYFWSIPLKQLLHVIPWFYASSVINISVSDDSSSLLIQDGSARVGIIEGTKFNELQFLLSAIFFQKIKKEQDKKKAIHHDN